MPKIGDIATSVQLGAGESAVVIWSPSDEISQMEGRFGSPTYQLHVEKDGEPALLSGGARLVGAIKRMLRGIEGKLPALLKLEVTAYGEAGTTERDWKVKRL